MIVTSRSFVTRSHGHPESPAVPTLAAMAEFEAEFVVDWQVAGDGAAGKGSFTPEK